MEIITDRLTIKPLLFENWVDLKRIWKDFSSSEYSQYDVPHTENECEIKHLARKFSEDNSFYIISLTQTGDVIGCVDLHNTGNGYDIGYCFISECHNKGYAKESCKALIEYYRNNGVKRFTAGTAIENIPSLRLLLSLGFNQIGSEKVSFYKDENGKDIFFDGGLFELL